MTAYPTKENHLNWWLTAGKWRRLHAVPAARITHEQMEAALDSGTPPRARAACGIVRRWQMPGLLSRIGKPRCAPCCAALGIPRGYGTPANEAARSAR